MLSLCAPQAYVRLLKGVGHRFKCALRSAKHEKLISQRGRYCSTMAIRGNVRRGSHKRERSESRLICHLHLFASLCDNTSFCRITMFFFRISNPNELNTIFLHFRTGYDETVIMQESRLTRLFKTCHFLSSIVEEMKLCYTKSIINPLRTVCTSNGCGLSDNARLYY